MNTPQEADYHMVFTSLHVLFRQTPLSLCEICVRMDHQHMSHIMISRKYLVCLI